MFDRHLHITERGHQMVTVNHKHAPTEESVKLLLEMEQAARDKVVQSIRLEDTPIDGVIHATDDVINMRRDYCVFVRIRGKQVEVRKSFDLQAEPEAVAQGLLQAVSERIAAELLAPAFARLPAYLRR
jgi:hypothetical protein